jgi:hypothetical protein
MFKLLAVMLLPVMTMHASDLPSRKYLNLAAIKTMVAASEAKAKELNVEVTICIVDESGNLLFLEKEDGASLNTCSLRRRRPGMLPHMAALQEKEPRRSRTATWKTWLSQFFPQPGRPAHSRGRPAPRRDCGERRKV